MNYFQIIIDIIQGIILGYFVVKMMNLKKEKSKIQYILVLMLFVFEILFFDFVYVYEGFYSLVYSLSIFIIGIAFSKNNPLELLIYSILFNIMLSVGNSIALLLMELVFGANFSMIIESSFYLNWTSVFSTISIFFLSLFTSRLAKKYVSVLIDNSKYYFLAFLIFYILITLIEELIFSHPILEEELLLIYFVIMFLFLILLFIFIKNIENSVQKMNLIVMNKQIDYFKNRISDFENSSKKLHVIKHDLKKALYTISNLIETTDIEEIKKYINEQLEIVEQEPIAFVTGNHNIDCILSSKILQCNDLNISFSYTIDKNALNIIQEMDMSLLLLNSLENAVENISTNNKRIYMMIQIINNMLIIKVENSVDYEILKINSELKTSKNDSESHGFGILSLKMIVDKYEGQIGFSQMKDMFICTIAIPI